MDGDMAVPPAAADANEKAGPRKGLTWYNGSATNTSLPSEERKSLIRTTLAADVDSHQAKVLASTSEDAFASARDALWARGWGRTHATHAVHVGARRCGCWWPVGALATGWAARCE